ncbi:MAG TPA: hypothetical protein VED01_26630 [Burkholderiales bacterium]|nr:hypothetical protein [Burkholderiales bacterium]
MARKKAEKKKGRKSPAVKRAPKQVRKGLRSATTAKRRSGEAGSGAAPQRAAVARKTTKRKGPARKAVRSGRTTGQKRRKDEVSGRPRRPSRAAAREEASGVADTGGE